MDSVMKDRLSLLAAVGCGIAFGVSGIYTYYKANREFSQQLDTLTHTIDDLRKEVCELRLASQVGSRAPSQVDTPIGFNHNFIFDNPAANYLSSQFHPNQSLSVLDSSNSRLDYSTDENEEFYDFTEGETEQDSLHSNSMSYQEEANTNHLNSKKEDKKEEIGLKEWLEEFDVLLDDLSTDKKLLHNKIKEAQKKYGNCADIAWRLAKVTHLLGIAAQKQNDEEKKKKLTFETMEIAKTAVEFDDTNPECHKWYAVAIGSTSDYLPNKEKIQNGNEFKHHLDIALRLKPDDPTLHHMLGRWSIEIANLTWVERKLANALFGKLPETSHQDALNAFLNAYKLKSDWKENDLYIAKTFIIMKKYKDAIFWIDKGIQLSSKGEDDTIAHKDLLDLQTKYNKYR